MVSKELEINFKIGIHGRPAALLVKKAMENKDITILISKDGKTSSAKSMMGLLSLGIGQGSKITVSAEGKDESVVLDTICNFITNDLIKES